jgi:hypothetical protein
MYNKKSFEIISETLLFMTYIIYIHIDYFLIFLYEILNFKFF